MILITSNDIFQVQNCKEYLDNFYSSHIFISKLKKFYNLWSPFVMRLQNAIDCSHLAHIGCPDTLLLFTSDLPY